MQRVKIRISAVALLLGAIAVLPSVASSATLEERVSRIENKLSSNALGDLFLQIQDLRNEVQRLQGKIDVQNNEIEGLKKRQREIYLDIDRRLQAIENRFAAPANTDAVQPNIPASPPSTTEPAVSAGSDTGPASAAAPAKPPAEPATVDPLVEQSAYRAALNMLKEGRYATAMAQFRAFLSKYPGSEYADNSHYWLGEASYVTQDYKQALLDFRKVVDNYPNSAKYPDALLKIGYCLFELKDQQGAIKALNEVRTRFPASTAARLAEQRLQKMKIQQNN
jgi:tol-pal system protein YbgF